jgi:hypothetical protein
MTHPLFALLLHRSTFVFGIVLLFAITYYAIPRVFPRNNGQHPHFRTDINNESTDSFDFLKLSFFDALYFSLVTQSTVGYGSIVPLSIVAKFFVALQVLSSLFMLIYLSTQFKTI